MAPDTVVVRAEIETEYDEESGAWIARCPGLNFKTAGRTEEEAVRAAQAGAETLAQDAFRRGVLFRDLLTRGFRPRGLRGRAWAGRKAIEAVAAWREDRGDAPC